MRAEYSMLGPFNRFPDPDEDLDGQDCVNLFLVSEEGAKKKFALLNTPGLEHVITIGIGPTVPTRNLFVFEDKMYAVFGSQVYFFDSSLNPVFIGALLTDRGYISIANNNGGQIIFIDGIAGYIYTPLTGAFVQIVDPDFPEKPIDVAYLDTYFVIPSGESQTFQISANNDGLSWNGFLDSAQIQTYPGINRGVGVVNERLYFFKDTSTEIWWNPGDADFPLRKDTNLNFNYGCVTAASIVSEYGYLMWLSQDKSGPASVMMSTGYTPVRVSTKAVEAQIANLTNAADMDAWIYKDEGRIFYVMNWTTDDLTLVVDIEMASRDPHLAWHRMAMLKKPPLEGDPNYSRTRHIGSCHAYFNGIHYIGSYKSPTLYSFDRLFADNDGEIIPRIVIGKPFSTPEYNAFQINKIQLDIKPGIGNVTGDYTDPVVLLSISRDGGHIFGNALPGTIGKVGKFKTRCLWRKKGWVRTTYVPMLEIRATCAPIIIMGDTMDINVLPK